MSRTRHLRRVLGGAFCVLALAACETVPTKPVAPPSIAEFMSKATAADSAGQTEAAIALWKEAAVAHPTEKQPWVSIAQKRFEAGQYGEAIVSAQEIQVRDPNDQKANSIIAISGLRLATRALADLSSQNNLSGDLRAESQDLAKLLRESLGVDVLVTKPGSKPQNRQPVQPKKTTKPAADSSANPFSDLLK